MGGIEEVDSQDFDEEEDEECDDDASDEDDLNNRLMMGEDINGGEAMDDAMSDNHDGSVGNDSEPEDKENEDDSANIIDNNLNTLQSK